MGVLFTQIEVAGCRPSCNPSVSHSVSHVPLRSPVAAHSISALDLPPRAPTPASATPSSNLSPALRTTGTARQTSKVVKNRHQTGDSGAQRPFFTTFAAGRRGKGGRERGEGRARKGKRRVRKGEGREGREQQGEGKGPTYSSHRVLHPRQAAGRATEDPFHTRHRRYSCQVSARNLARLDGPVPRLSPKLPCSCGSLCHRKISSSKNSSWSLLS